MPYGSGIRDTTRKPLFTPGMRVNWEHPLNTDLVAWWIFNDNTPFVRDVVSESAVGTFTGNPLWEPTQKGLGLKTDGISDYVTIPFGSALDGKLFTIVASIFPVSYANSTPRVIDRVYNDQFAFYIVQATTYIGGSGKSNSATADGTVGSIPVTAGLWHTVSITWDGVNLYAYVDGQGGGSLAFAGTGLASSTSNIRIAERVDAGTSRAANLIYNYIAIYSEGKYMRHQILFHQQPWGTPDNPRLI